VQGVCMVGCVHGWVCAWLGVCMVGCVQGWVCAGVGCVQGVCRGWVCAGRVQGWVFAGWVCDGFVCINQLQNCPACQKKHSFVENTCAAPKAHNEALYILTSPGNNVNVTS